MASRKQRRKTRARKVARNAGQSPAGLVASARKALAEGNGRRALDLLKQAQRAHESPETLASLLYCASICRARNLEEKGMRKEGAAMRARAEQYRSLVDCAALSPEDLRPYFTTLETAESLAEYAVYASRQERNIQVERLLADKLVVDGRWEGLSALEPDDPFRRDAELARPGAEAMEAGDWEGAGERFRKIGRRSPFAPWRLFCKAMVHFRDGDDDQLRRAVEPIPDDFAMAGTVAAWKHVCTGKGDGGSAAVRSALGLDAGGRRALADDLARALDENAPSARIAATVSALAERLLPECPEAAAAELLQAAGLAMLGPQVRPATIRNVARRVFPRDRADAVFARTQLMVDHRGRRNLETGAALTVLRSLPAEYPDRRERAIARGCVLESLARTASELHDMIDYSGSTWDELNRLLGHEIEDPLWISVELIAASLRADTRNRDGYLFLCELIKQGAPGGRKLESLLTQMANRFPNDPLPLLEMASDYYSRNAYRKAETVLTEAARRAPHDESIRDRLAIGFLKSAWQSFKAGRFGAAFAGFGRAEAMERPRLATVLPAKRILVEMLTQGGIRSDVLTSRLEERSPVDQIRILLLMLHDFPKFRKHKRFPEEARQEIRAALAERRHLVKGFSADEVLSFLPRLPADFRILFESHAFNTVVMAEIPNFLRGLGEDRLFEALDALLATHMNMAVRKEIEIRLGSLPSPDTRLLLRFYRAVLDVSEHREKFPGQLAEIVEQADPAATEKLRAAAMRLSQWTRRDVAEALHNFDFTILGLGPMEIPEIAELLEAMPGLQDLLESDSRLGEILGEPGGRVPGPSEEDDGPGGFDVHGAVHYLANEAEEYALNPDKGMSFYDQVNFLEVILEENGWESFSSTQLRSGIEEVRSCPLAAEYLDLLAEQCARADFRDALSPAANVLLFWGSAKRGRRPRKR